MANGSAVTVCSCTRTALPHTLRGGDSIRRDGNDLAVTEVTFSETPGTERGSMSKPSSLAGAVIKSTRGAESAEADAYLNRLESAFRPALQFLAELAEAYAKWVRVVAVELEQWARKIEAAPEVEGHEKLLIESVGHHPLLARLWARFLQQCGSNWAAEINDGRRASAVIRQLAKATEASSLVISRRAKTLREVCSPGHAEVAIKKAIERTAAPIMLAEFDALVERACGRDEEACASLPQICKRLTAGLPEPRGRLMSEATGIHVFVRRHFESYGLGAAYTYRDYDDGSDFVDEVTRATRLAVKNPRFSPLYANTLLKGNTLPPAERIASAANEGPRSRSSAPRKRKPTT